MLMKKASDPSVVREAFNAVGVPLDGSSATPQSSELPQAGPGDEVSQSSLSAVPSQWRTTCRDLSQRIATTLTVEQLNDASAAWFSPNAEKSTSGERSTQDQVSFEESSLSTIDAAIAQLASLQTDPATATPDAEQWDARLRQYRQLWAEFVRTGQRPDLQPSGAKPSGSPPAVDVTEAEIAVFKNSVSDSLDAALVAGLKNAAFWKTQETTAFFRLLQRAEQGGSFEQHQSAPETNTLQLEAEADRLRGELVRFRGEVYRIESSSGDDPISQSKKLFCNLWLRGEDRANQPVSIYCTENLASKFDTVPPAGKSKTLSDPKPRVSVTAWVGKRMAYQAQKGIEVAPTLFATTIDIAAPDVLPPVEDDPNILWKLVKIVLAAGLLSFTIVWLMRSGQKRNTPVRRKSMLWIMLLLPQLSAAAQDNSVPPWAQTNESMKIRLLVQSTVDQAWQMGTLEELQQHAKSPAGSTQLPDGMLKTMRVLNQIGWKRAAIVERLTSNWIEMARVRFRGVVVGCEAVALTPTQLQWFQEDDVARLFRLKIKHRGLLENDFREVVDTATVYCTRVPIEWMGQSELKQPATIEGFALSTSGYGILGDSNCILADAPRWLLQPWIKPEALRPVLPARLWALGQAGWDLANLDIIARNNQRPLSKDESAAYFSLMQRMDRVSQSLDFTSASTKATAVLNGRAPKTGLPLSWNVRLVSGTVVDVPAEDQKALGSYRYFQMDGFVDLGNQRLSYLTKTDRGETREVTFEREFPIALVTTDARLVPADVASGSKSTWKIGKYMQASGVLYRLWAFRSDLIESRGASSLQAAPLVILADLEDSLPPVRKRGSPIGWFGGALCLVVLCLLGLILYFASKNDRRRPATGSR
ncbi:MAG: hypothetical protein Aurels2KO_22090 [Aureliella sp.]